MLYNHPIYKNSPVWVQNALISGRAYVRQVLRERGLNRELDDVLKSQWLGQEAMARLQLDRLQKVVRHAAAHVPYYRESFEEAGFRPDQLVSLEDMQRIPILTKSSARKACGRLLAENASGPRFSTSTSGTTGEPMTVRRDLRAINRENAFILRQYQWAGAKPSDRRVWLRGEDIVSADVKAPPFWRYSKSDTTLMMSSYHLSESRAESYIQAIEAFDPVFGMAYPSPLVFLARYMVSQGRKYRGKSLRGFITSSETLTPEQRKVVCDAFNCRVFDWYGSSERVTAIGTCEHGTYHILSDYGFTELVPQGDGTCSVVGTAFDNHLMPWIRFELGDSIVPADPSNSCPCGRNFPLVERIVGRAEPYVIAADGRHVFMMSNAIDGVPNLLAGQVRQEAHGEIKFLVVAARGTSIDKAQIIASARRLLGEGTRITVEEVTAIPLTSSGKQLPVVRTI